MFCTSEMPGFGGNHAFRVDGLLHKLYTRHPYVTKSRVSYTDDFQVIK